MLSEIARAHHHDGRMMAVLQILRPEVMSHFQCSPTDWQPLAEHIPAETRQVASSVLLLARRSQGLPANSGRAMFLLEVFSSRLPPEQIPAVYIQLCRTVSGSGTFSPRFENQVARSTAAGP